MMLRIEVQDLLETLLGSRNVYFQPPSNLQMSYPCIIYNLSKIEARHADNAPYSFRRRYQVTVVDANPDSDIPARVAQLPTSEHERFFTADNLNHNVFNIFF